MVRVAMHPLSIHGVGPRVGFINIDETESGVWFRPEIAQVGRFGLGPGPHGFHVHEAGNLLPGPKDGKVIAGGAAGDHYDPLRTKTHRGPIGHGHRGDLPFLEVNPSGDLSTPVFAPRVRLNDILGRAIIVHAGGDTYSDTPPSGGGFDRVLGGIITNDCPYCKKNEDRNMNTLLAIGVGAVGLGLAWMLSGQKDEPKGSRSNAACPRPTQDLALNTQNRQLAIDKYDYGPLNPKEPSTAFWKKIASRWNKPPSAKNIEEAKSARCGNCVAFDVSPRMEACMPGPVTNAGKLGYCWMHDFKCASLRTCATWAGGGPITSDTVSLDWQRRKGG